MTEQQLRNEVARLLAAGELSYAPIAKLNQIEDVMERLRVGRSTVFALLASGRLRSVKIGRRRLVPEQALSDFIAGLDA
jgi:excisionase family DNA binding protein